MPPRVPIDDLPREVTRLADRLRSLTDVRLSRPLPPYGSRADAAHAVAQLMADAAATLDGEPRRAVPRLTDFAVADQVAVTGTDLVSAAAVGSGAAPAPGVDVDALIEAVLARCRELSAAL